VEAVDMKIAYLNGEKVIVNENDGKLTTDKIRYGLMDNQKTQYCKARDLICKFNEMIDNTRTGAYVDDALSVIIDLLTHADRHLWSEAARGTILFDDQPKVFREKQNRINQRRPAGRGTLQIIRGGLPERPQARMEILSEKFTSWLDDHRAQTEQKPHNPID